MAHSKEKNKRSAREIAYLALVSANKEENFISHSLEQWIVEDHPSPRDAALAREIAYGTCRMALTLDAIAAQCTPTGKLSLKTKEKILLRTALYQHFYLERIPLYAIANESLDIARKYCHAQFVKFLNALLRKLEGFTPRLPTGSSEQDLSTLYSYPPYFVQRLIEAYGLEQAIRILKAGNEPAPTVFRLRAKDALDRWPKAAYAFIENTMNESAILLDSQQVSEVAATPTLYIQNATPTALCRFLKEGAPTPQNIADLCASPGGKLLLAHDLFPEATLHANDVNAQKIARLQENIQRFGLEATISCGPGEDLQIDERFDLIILDVPCSNTGVLNKRPEARWRLSDKQVVETLEIQRKLLRHAAQLLSPTGEIWYLTCSILPEENENLIQEICKELKLKPRKMKTILPDAYGWDGGYACALCKAL